MAIYCDYCQTEIEAPPPTPADRRISAAINRPPDPAPAGLDLHACCVDLWVTAAKAIHGEKPTTQEV